MSQQLGDEDLSEACEKCGADVSWQGAEHANCAEVVRLRTTLKRMAAMIEAVFAKEEDIGPFPMRSSYYKSER